MRERTRRMAVVTALALAAGAACQDYSRVEEPEGEVPAITPDRSGRGPAEPAEEGEEEPILPDDEAGAVPERAGVPGDPVTEPFDPDLDTDRDGVLDPDEGLGDADGDGVRDRDEPRRP